MKKILTSPILLYGALIIFIILYADSCNRERTEENRYHTNLNALRQELSVSKTKLGQITAQKEALVVTNKELREGLFIKDDSLQDLLKKFRKVQAAFVINTTIDLKPGTLELEPPNALGERTFRKATPHYTVAGRVLPNTVALDTLSMFNTQRLVLGTHRGFFNRTITAEITNSNPHIQTTDLSTQVINERVKRFGLSVYTGYGLSENLTLSPQIGVGLTFDLLRF